MTFDDIAIAIERGDINISEIQAVAKNGNEFNCSLANRVGLPFEAWLRWVSLPNANENAQRWAKRLLSELAL